MRAVDLVVDPQTQVHGAREVDHPREVEVVREVDAPHEQLPRVVSQVSATRILASKDSEQAVDTNTVEIEDSLSLADLLKPSPALEA